MSTDCANICRICLGCLDDDDVAVNCTGECDNILVSEYAIPPRQELNFHDNVHIDTHVPKDYVEDDDYLYTEEHTELFSEEGDDYGC